MKPLTLGFSPCPNDTYIFYALTHHQVQCAGFSFDTPLLEDVETLNRWAMVKRLDVTKLSFHALGHVLDDYVMLHAGAALGRGCGPLLVTGSGRGLDLTRARIAIPGKFTTAALLLKLYAPKAENLVVMRFEEIMAAVSQGSVDAGVIIHESRFTYRDFALECVEDLGAWWEAETGLPIPLGCIAARKNFADGMLREIDRAVRESLCWARSNPEECMEYIRRNAQEMTDSVLHSHIGLYVNEYSVDIGAEGIHAVEELFRRGRAAGIFPGSGHFTWDAKQ